MSHHPPTGHPVVDALTLDARSTLSDLPPAARMRELAWWTVLAVGSGVFMAWLEQGGAPCIYCPPVAVAVAFLLRMGWGVWPIVLAVEMLTEWLLSGRPPATRSGSRWG